MLASAIVQAIQCPLGDECPRDSEPQNGLSLLQTQLQTNVIKMGGSINLYATASKFEEMVELSHGMASGSRTRCPNNEVASVSEITFCSALLRAAEKHGDCIVYNFGVGEKDAFLSYLGKEYKHCQVFAFDPTVSEKTWESQGGSKAVFGQNVAFFPWGLYGGQGSRTLKWTHPIYGNATGELRTLSEIMHDLGHTSKRIAMLRSDCEGCEWGWISTQMEEDPTVFSRIDQLFTELHFASTLRMDEAAMQQAPVVHKMLHDNFAVVQSRVNPGYKSDQNKVPKMLVEAGVDPMPCCREFALLNKAVLPVLP